MSQTLSSSSRRRGGATVKEATTEDQALNMIAREAEARLAAKRAARAEARSIRMREIERKQNENEEEVDVSLEDNDNSFSGSEKKSSVLPTYDIPDTVVPSLQVTNDNQILQLKEAVREGEMKYKKAMVNSAQLDNERQALQYHVEILKDIIEELQQRIENTDDELVHKCKEYNKLNREYTNTTSELNKCLSLLQERERVLDENGINVDGTIKEGYEGSSALCGKCCASLNNGIETADHHRERGSLLAEIASLKREIDDLKETGNSKHSRIDQESSRTERHELEQSFADVSNEAAVIREDALHTGFYINNNEKNDDFEMIDDSLQHGGIRHFEDQSFEKSTSSVVSSTLTDGMMSMESSVPLEISVDNISKSVQKDDYDIIIQHEDGVHVSDKNRSIIDTKSEYISSVSSGSGSDTLSNININKYLFDDHSDTLNEESEQSGGFSVDRYFATESVASNVNCNVTVEDKVENPRTDEISELQTSVDTITNVQSDYDTIDTEEVVFNSDLHFTNEENRNSPYEDLQVDSVAISRPCDGLVIIDEPNSGENIPINKTSEKVDNVELLDGHTLVESKEPVVESVIQTDLEVSVEAPVNDEKSNTNILDTAAITVESTSSQLAPTLDEGFLMESSEDTEITLENQACEIPLDSEITKRETLFETNDKTSDSPISIPMSIPKSIDIPVTPIIESNVQATTSNSTDAPLLGRVESISEDDKAAMRKSLEELYNQIAEETNEGNSPLCESDVNITKEDDEKKGWLVQVASFSAPKVEAPEIEIVDVEPQPKPLPEPKERKKKKKKKHSNKTDESNVVQVVEMPEDVSVPSDPFLLGFATEPDGVKKPEIPIEQTNVPKRDIPKQFLDASAELIDNNYSDVSDNEDEAIGEDGKKKSLKRSKKEGCKSQ